MKKIVSVFFIFMSLIIYSQNNIKGKIEDLEKLKSRDLAVIIFDLNNAEITKLEKKIVKTKKADKKQKLIKELKSLKELANNFNNNLKEIVPKYWKINDVSKITYLTKEEATKLREAKSNKFVILDFSPDEARVSTFNWNSFKANFNLVTYAGSEKKRTKSNYRNFLINTNYNFPKTRFKNKNQKKLVDELEKELGDDNSIILSKENLIVSLILFQDHIKSVLASKKEVSFQKYAEQESSKNCGELKGKKILVQSAIIGSKVYKNFSDYKDSVEMVSATRIKNAIVNKEDVFIGFPVIKQFYKAKSSFGALGFVSINTIDHKLVYNPSTGKIIAFNKASYPLNYRSFKKKDFENLFECGK